MEWRIALLGFSCCLLATQVTQASGLDQRPANPTCRAPERPLSNPDLRVMLEPAFGGLPLSYPTAASQAQSDAWYVTERNGRLQRIAASSKSVALDLTDRVSASGEGGLLGIALDPDFADNHHVYLYYTRANSDPAYPLVTIVSRFTSTNGGTTFDSGSEKTLLSIPQPSLVHKAGDIHFGPDGFLYVALGDGGFDALTAQDTSTLLGSMLRIDVHGGDPYAIPPDNPFAAGGGVPEIWAWGFRNPYRWSFDTATGDLWAADVGAGNWEEIDLVEGGVNYGWPHREGAHCLRPSTCNQPQFVDPVFEYHHTMGCAIIGGFVYRGSAVPALDGSYVYGDFCSARIWATTSQPDGSYASTELAVSPTPFMGFAQGDDGEVLVLHYGGAYRLALDTRPAPPPLPATLTETGCVDPQDPRQPASGLIPYDVAAPLWSDGAGKRRWFALPDGARITVRSDGDFALPAGSVAVKNFYLGSRIIETRLFVHHQDGVWAGYTYEWNDEQTQAFLLPGGLQKEIDGQVWTYPSREECMRCHTFAAGFTLGLEALQLNEDFFYQATGRTDNQIETLQHIGLFASPVGNPPRLGPSLSSTTLNGITRAYLHANCSNCHRLYGGTGSNMDLRFQATISQMRTCDVLPAHGDLGIALARLLAPGAPERSMLSVRAHLVGASQMPPLARAIPDPLGTASLDAWIRSWPNCDGPDGDSDGVRDALDNCPTVANPDQVDANANAIGDDCETGCRDGIDNDADGWVDWPADPGCSGDFGWLENPPCDDGVDNDGDGFVDGPLDVACKGRSGGSESRSCADGVDDDGDGLVDFDGGAWVPGGGAPTAPDPQCSGRPWLQERREPHRSCGLGFELAFLMPILVVLGRARTAHRRFRTRTCEDPVDSQALPGPAQPARVEAHPPAWPRLPARTPRAIRPGSSKSAVCGSGTTNTKS